jgi:hypothetical protein
VVGSSSTRHLLPLLLAAAACEPVSEASGPASTTTHALLKVEHSRSVGAGPASARALAGVVRVPELADPEPLLRLYGGGLPLPAAGQCASISDQREGAVAPELARAELLDAGDVSLSATDVETRLAPRAFPSSISELPGVVYTSRDSAPEALPAGALYSLKASGSDQLAPLELRVRAPELLSEVSVAGAPITELLSLNAASGAELSWRPGDARDLVYVEVAATAVGTLGVCAFRDSRGRGELPRGLFGARGAGSLSIHRLREVAADAPALDAAEVRFDFELTTEVSFQ